jgi:type III secretion system low calcium response chaperone LcrH/SycD
MKEPLSSFKISKEARKRLKDKDYLKKQLAKGKTAQQILGVSTESMQEFYEAAYHLFNKGRFEDAGNAFLFLVTLDPHNFEYWLGLGASAQMMDHIDEAIDAYEMAAYYRIESPLPYFYLARCFYLKRDYISALEALHLAIEYSDDFEEFADLKKQALEIRAMLLKKR